MREMTNCKSERHTSNECVRYEEIIQTLCPEDRQVRKWRQKKNDKLVTQATSSGAKTNSKW